MRLGGPSPGDAPPALWPGPGNRLVSTGMVESGRLGGNGILLRPGDWLFGSGDVRVSTLLGSCVAVVLWAPRLRLGAMCHCVLPERPVHEPSPTALDGRYGSDSGQWLASRFSEAGCRWSEVEATLAGGAQSVPSNIGAANIAWAHAWAEQQGLRYMQQDVGGRVVRRLTFNLADGSLTVAHGGRISAEPS